MNVMRPVCVSFISISEAGQTCQVLICVTCPLLLPFPFILLILPLTFLHYTLVLAFFSLFLSLFLLNFFPHFSFSFFSLNLSVFYFYLLFLIQCSSPLQCTSFLPLLFPPILSSPILLCFLLTSSLSPSYPFLAIFLTFSPAVHRPFSFLSSFVLPFLLQISFLSSPPLCLLLLALLLILPAPLLHPSLFPLVLMEGGFADFSVF